MTARDPRDVIIRPVVSETSYASFDNDIYTFVVASNANKIEIRHAVESIFNVRVVKVNTINRKGKRKRNRRSGNWSTKPDERRALITLREGDRIEIFGS
jgi:large subunit ribosomal protein L23